MPWKCVVAKQNNICLNNSLYISFSLLSSKYVVFLELNQLRWCMSSPEHKGKKMQHLRSLLFMHFYVSVSQLLNSMRQLSHTELSSMIKEKRTQIKQSNRHFLLRLSCLLHVFSLCMFLSGCYKNRPYL